MAGRKPIKDRMIYNIAFPGELVKRIDNYRYANRFPTRAEAIRFLIEQGLKVEPGRGE